MNIPEVQKLREDKGTHIIVDENSWKRGVINTEYLKKYFVKYVLKNFKYINYFVSLHLRFTSLNTSVSSKPIVKKTNKGKYKNITLKYIPGLC